MNNINLSFFKYFKQNRLSVAVEYNANYTSCTKYL